MTGATQHGIIFLPFLRLKKGLAIAGVEFLPLRDADGKTPVVLESAAAPLTTILSGYNDRHGKPFTNCVVAAIPGRGWDLAPEDMADIGWASSLLFLASWACNEYYPKFGGAYVNSTAFRPVGQNFTGDTPTFIAVVARRRDGSSWDGGYEHGQFKFNLPLQCSVGDPVDVDEAFLAGLDAAVNANSPLVERLRFALPYVTLANTDDQLMEQLAEAILMGSAFEQTLKGDASAYKLAKKFGMLFTACGSVTVEDARKARPGIEIDSSTPEHAAAQAKWWVHQKWIEELYGVRSKAVHKGHHKGRTWGWEIFEHLVMAAWVYPLTVKMLLAADGHYALTDADQTRCRAVDRLLAVTGWGKKDAEQNTVWDGIVSQTTLDDDAEKRLQEFLKTSGFSLFVSDDPADT
jgi:hypothetical protein